MQNANSQPPPPRCWAEIDPDAFARNAVLARERSHCELLAIVKANAYGHGAAAVARAIDQDATMFGVANVQEARELREAGVGKPVLLLGSCLAPEMEVALHDGFQLCVSSLGEAVLLNDMASRLGRQAVAHVIVDTGMGRMGFPLADWNAKTIAALLRLRGITWEGLASHLPAADGDEDDAAFTRSQIAVFQRCVDTAHGAGLRPRWIHLSNSAGLLGFSETHGLCNLARPGLMLYGVSPLVEWQKKLCPALNWKTRVVLVRELPAGHGISYGRSYITTRPMKVATLACGYADGYPRQVSGRGADVLIHGERCPVLGRVTMDQLMVDVTELKPDAQPGDEVVLLGSQGAAHISATELAEKAGTIPWHIFTGIGERVQRVYL